MSKIGLMWRTVRHLKRRQIVYQVWNRLRGRPTLGWQKTVPNAHFLTMPDADKPVSWQDGVFTFLNQRVSFPHQIDWNYAAKGKLWTYHLNYFDFLNQPGLSLKEGLNLIRDFIAQTDSLRIGLESYPTSLRIINWVQFLSRNQIQDTPVNSHLFAQTQLLSRRLEYHLVGNHLLENGFALLTSALYFQHGRWFRTAATLIRAELTTQILVDGGHEERSPMYHQILLDRLLTVLLALQYDTWHTDLSLSCFLTQKATSMLGWLNAITFRNGDTPMVNDAAFDVAPTTAHLQQKARSLKIPSPSCQTAINAFSLLANRIKQGDGVSGYRMFRQNRYELFVDVGLVGPNHQPGHAHADTLSFVLYVDNAPVLVDSGTSTYQRSERRAWERSTAAHNTVEVADVDSSEVWAGFRVGHRARVTLLTNTKTTLTARHDGYRHLGVLHERAWLVEPARLTIIDHLTTPRSEAPNELPGVARFHFQPGIQVLIIGNTVLAGPVFLSFSSAGKLTLSVASYAMASGFNKMQSGQCLEIAFVNSVETTLTLPDELTLPDVLFRA